jgi:hypothetical protein
LECQGELEAKLKIPDGGMMMSKAWEVDHGSHFLGTKTYGEIQGEKEDPAYGIH